MRKFFYLTSLIVILLLAQTRQAQASDDKSVVYDYDGNVILLRRGIGLTMKSDLLIKKNDILRTDSNGTVDIIMNQLAGIRFQTTSECLFDDIKSGSVHLTLYSGHALFNLKPMPSGGTFTLETPNAVITTNVLSQFLCNIEGEGDNAFTHIAVKRGRIAVQVKSSSAHISLLENQAVEIRPETFIVPPRTLSEEETKALFKINSVIINTDESL